MKNPTVILFASLSFFYTPINHIDKDSPILVVVPKTEQPIIEEIEIDPVEKFVISYSKKHDLDPELVFAVINVESKGIHNSKSHKGAIGIMQLMPKTAEWLEVDPNDLEDNIRGGIKYLSMNMKRYKNVRLALAAYNAGPGNVDKYGRTVPPFKETLNYVSKICALYSSCGSV